MKRHLPVALSVVVAIGLAVIPQTTGAQPANQEPAAKAADVGAKMFIPAGPIELNIQNAMELLELTRPQLDALTKGKVKLTPAQFKEFQASFERRADDGIPLFKSGERSFALIPAAKLLEKPKAPNAPVAAAPVAAPAARPAAPPARDAAPPAGEGAAARGEGSPPENSTQDATPPADPAAGPAQQAAQVTPPDKVDHSDRQTAVRDQGDGRNTCVAFATCAAMERIMKSTDPSAHAPINPDLNENLAYYWLTKEESTTPCQDQGVVTVNAADTLNKHVVCDESLWPYIDTPTSILRNSNPSRCDLVDTPKQEVWNQPGRGIKTWDRLDLGTEINADGSFDIRDTRTLESILADGREIVIGVGVAWRNSQLGDIVDVTLGPTTNQPIASDGGHAMLIVGYDRSDPNKPHFILKNSWGTHRGINGYMKLSYDYIRAYAKYGFAIKTLSDGTVVP